MEVAFFTESYLPTRDGVASVVSGLARSLERLGHQVRVYTPNPASGGPSETVEDDGVSVARARSIPVPLYAQYRWAVFPFNQLRGSNFGEAVDVIHLHTPGIMGSTGFLASRHFRKPLVGTFHTNVLEMQESFPGRPMVQLFLRIAWWYGLGTYWRCDAATAPTRTAAHALETHARKPFRRPVQVIPNGIEVDRFRPGIRVPDWRERCGLPTGPLVTFLGRLTADKGIHRFLDAIESLSGRGDFSAIIAGTGPDEPTVRRRLAGNPQLASRVRYVGPVTEEEKPALLSQSDLFVLPSTADTSSIALLEAMASGATCLASNEGGPGELITDGVTGRQVSIRRPGALAESLTELLDDRAQRLRLSAAGLSWARTNASIDATARRFISLYELLLTERRNGGFGHARGASGVRP